MNRFVTSDGIGLSYYTDDFTNPWKKTQTVLLLHAAMGSARRYFGWIPYLCRDYRVVRLEHSRIGWNR
jgi:3-oxoadipate enol-lactonase